ncbi:unannotated protein [freshwater metagenome]|uniref:Unannotated protein n=1 Tax=freshwater metagenome TaxID=449393 RepID=A0A6J6RZE7_9ZZZZ
MSNHNVLVKGYWLDAAAPKSKWKKCCRHHIDLAEFTRPTHNGRDHQCPNCERVWRYRGEQADGQGTVTYRSRRWPGGGRQGAERDTWLGDDDSDMWNWVGGY